MVGLLVALTLVVDTIRGAHIGQRLQIVFKDRVSFGRHPDNTVVFDAIADRDASSRHAVLLKEEHSYLLRDVGSSHGTWIDNRSIQVQILPIEYVMKVEFGKGGPILRLWLGEDLSLAPAKIGKKRGWRCFRPK